MNTAKNKTVVLLQEFSIPLIVGVILAILGENLMPHAYHAIIHWSPIGSDYYTLHFIVNDIFMALFFGIAAKEIAESCLPGGDLNPPSKAINPLLGTLGGVLGPVGVYFAYVAISGDSSIANGWGIPAATDIALAWLIARIVFGAGHPAVSFLLLLAIADDAIGLGIIAVFYPNPDKPVMPIYLLLVAAGMGVSYALNKKKVTNYWAYLATGGLLAWFGLYKAGVHPALALVPIVPFMPHAARDLGLFVDSDKPDTMNDFEHSLKLPVDFGLFFFGLCNAGVAFSSVGNATWAVLLGLSAGKIIGITGFSYIGHLMGFKLPNGMGFGSLITVSAIAGIGLTVALFVAGEAFTEPGLQGMAKMGALLSALMAVVGIVFGKVFNVKAEYQKFLDSKKEPEAAIVQEQPSA